MALTRRRALHDLRKSELEGRKEVSVAAAAEWDSLAMGKEEAEEEEEGSSRRVFN